MAEDAVTADTAHLALEDKALNTPSHSSRSEKTSKQRRGGGGRGGGGGGQPREVVVSKALSRLLRHQAENAGIKLDAEGYAPLDKVLAYGPVKSLGVSVGEVRGIVGGNDKQRFGMKLKNDEEGSGASALEGEERDASEYLIRANQGHSIKIESEGLLEELSLEKGNIPPRVVHGTYYAFWDKIVQSGGLKRMGRNHVHCSTGLPTPKGASGSAPESAEPKVISGMRADAELLVEIDMERSIKDGGLKWWRSDNGVVLTEGEGPEGIVRAEFFKQVKGVRSEVGVIWEDGKWVSDLPEGLKMRVPHGKGPRGGGRGGRGRGGRGRGS